mmetsp:Transcript_95397/g.248726  ORF Transcript_95397/g.248726 Transcript_95397/m.248726 type:complete len:105 (-) Transcript_95397:37-351(-)
MQRHQRKQPPEHVPSKCKRQQLCSWPWWLRLQRPQHIDFRCCSCDTTSWEFKALRRRIARPVHIACKMLRGELTARPDTHCQVPDPAAGPQRHVRLKHAYWKRR